MPFVKGYKPTATHLKRLSDSHKGKTPSNKGQKMGIEFRENVEKEFLVVRILGQKREKSLLNRKWEGKITPDGKKIETKLI